MTEGTQELAAAEPPAPSASTARTLEELAGAEVIAEGKWAVAECPSCEWRSRRTVWWAIAQDRADKHNNENHSVLHPAPGTPRTAKPQKEDQ